jgi:hypothetical protein
MLGKVQSVVAILRDLLIIVFLVAFLILGVQIAQGLEKRAVLGGTVGTWVDPVTESGDPEWMTVPGQDEGN